MTPLLSAQNLYLVRSGREILRVESFGLHRGETVALVGPNGAGKTSLLLTLALLQPPTSGTIRLNGDTAAKGNDIQLRRRMAVVFQEALLLDTTVRNNILTPLRIRGVDRKEAELRAEKWLKRFGIAELAHRAARRLSGGEAQRASLARAFAMEPQVLFLDEPFASLDYPTRNALLGELGEILKESGVTTLLVTHDYTEIPPLAERVAVMYGGRLIKSGTIGEILPEEVLERRRWNPWGEE